LSAPGLQLTDRDRTLLETLGVLRVLTTRQVQRLLFPSEQIALRRLRMLAEAGYLRVDRSAVSAHRLVTATRYGLSALGNESLSGKGARPRSALFLQHQLGVNAFRLSLGQACARRSDLELLGFLADLDAVDGRPGAQPRRVLSGILGASDGHVPDGAFALRRSGRTALFFFEYDRGTEVLGNSDRGVGRMIRAYLNALLSGSYRQSSDVLGTGPDLRGFRALIVTTTPTRIENIRRLWTGVSGPIAIGKRFVWLAPSNVLESEDIMRESWVSLDAADERVYSMLGESS
jgi:hypothetical protein